MGPIACPETSVNHRHSPRNNPEESSYQLLRGGSRKLQKKSCAKQVRTALSWAITQQVVVISYRRFGTTRRIPCSGLSPIFGGSISLSPENGTDRLPRNVGKGAVLKKNCLCARHDDMQASRRCMDMGG
jgi:hypothetical protein